MMQMTIDYAGEERQRQDRQLARVQSVMADGKWRTLDQIGEDLWKAFAAHYMSTSVSARLRDLRKLGHTVERRRIATGLWEYRVI